MKVAGIIAEYNPFHDGHAYLISKAKEMGYTDIVICMSGNFVQRGEPAIFEKHIRAKMALEHGADLVLELPTRFAMSNAEHFAKGAVSILESLNVIDSLIYGSESGNLVSIKESKNIKEKLKAGISYPKALDINIGPNDILGHEYRKFLKTIKPIPVLRKSTVSARDIREQMTIDKKGFNYSDFNKAAFGILKRLSIDDLKKIPDLSEGIENRLYDAIRNSSSYEEMLLKAKTKRYTMARIKRLYMYAVLGLDKDYYDMPVSSARILGISKKGEGLLKVIKIETSTQLFDEKEASFTDLYNYNKPSGLDYREKVIKL